MFRSLPRVLGFAILALCVGSLLTFTDSATGQFLNGNHQKDKKLPPIFDKGFRPGFGAAPKIFGNQPRPPANNLLGQQNQGNQGGNQGFGGGFGGQGGFGGGQFGGGAFGGGAFGGFGGGAGVGGEIGFSGFFGM